MMHKNILLGRNIVSVRYGFDRDDMERFERCCLMRGIALDGLLKREEAADTVAKAAVLAIADGAQPLTRELAIERLCDFLSVEANWLQAEPARLFDWLLERGLIESLHESDVRCRLQTDLKREQLQAYLSEKKREREQLREDKRTQLQEKNRLINAPKRPDVDKDIDEAMMRLALQEARAAEERGEVPVGAVLVRGGQVVCADGNRVIERHDPTAHAEMLVLRQAAQLLENERVSDATLYVTLEPCPMCACALAHARVERVVWGADDLKNGGMGGRLDLARAAGLNHRAYGDAGILRDECEQMLKTFFARRRAERTTDEMKS